MLADEEELVGNGRVIQERKVEGGGFRLLTLYFCGGSQQKGSA